MADDVKQTGARKVAVTIDARTARQLRTLVKGLKGLNALAVA
jgi:hypothetical protein